MTSLNTYSCKVRLAGSLYNEVFKEKVTAAEVHVLRKIHGSDAVVEIKHTGSEVIDYDTEYNRLLTNYSKTVEQGDEEVPLVVLMYPYGKDFPRAIPGVPVMEKPEAFSAKEASKVAVQEPDEDDEEDEKVVPAAKTKAATKASEKAKFNPFE